jgi:hypothetical protein
VGEAVEEGVDLLSIKEWHGCQGGTAQCVLDECVEFSTTVQGYWWAQEEALLSAILRLHGIREAESWMVRLQLHRKA